MLCMIFYDICQIISHFINKRKYFTLAILNERKQHFEYGPIEIGNICGEISMTHIQNRHLRMSARDMMTFITFFPAMVGDLVPSDDEVWEFLLNLLEIIDIVLCFEITDVPLLT